MFIGFRKRIIYIIYFLFPLLYYFYNIFIIILINLLITSPNFLKNHKEFNILFYIHSSLSTFNLVLFFSLSLLYLIFFFTKLNIFIPILKHIAFYGITISLISLITGIFWGYFAWGQWVILDNKTYLILVILFIYLLIYYLILFSNLTEFSITNKILLIIFLISLPFWKILSSWWTTLHQSFSISLLGISFPSNLLLYFLIIFLVIILSLIIVLLVEIYINLIKF